MTSQKNLPSYKNPPVVEVVCGVLFSPLEKFLLPHFGLLWEKFKPEYPVCQEHELLLPNIERLERSDVPIELPPSLLPRVWFLQKDGKSLIQVQKDRFLHNWRKQETDQEYPRYERIIRSFDDRLGTFLEFLKEHELGALKPEQYEMTYLNHINQGEGWNALNDLGGLFPDFARTSGKSRFLTSIEAINWNTSFALPEKKGRLHVSIRSAFRVSDFRPVIILDMTVRGRPPDDSPKQRLGWFDLAHEWIVQGFADVTGRDIQLNHWRLEE
jgi:uncharacterized protein (TIGR04255 family)